MCIRWLSEVEALYVEFRKVPKAEVNHGLSPPDNFPESRHAANPLHDRRCLSRHKKFILTHRTPLKWELTYPPDWLNSARKAYPPA